VCLKDERTGDIHDYSSKRGVEHTEIVFPAGMSGIDRSRLWNNAEAAETRKNSTVAREYEIALPDELNQKQRQDLALEFARHLASRYGVAADVAIHAPGQGGDHRNHHAHILTTTRQVAQGGTLGAKTRSLDDRRSGEVEHVRSAWAHLVNGALEQAGRPERVSHKSLEAQGINRQATVHLGPTVTTMERRGIKTDRGGINRQLASAQGIRKEIEVAEWSQSKLPALKEQVKGFRELKAREAESARRELEKAARAAEEKAKLQKEKEAAEKAKARNRRSQGMER
jgi:MobA/MobL family.